MASDVPPIASSMTLSAVSCTPPDVRSIDDLVAALKKSPNALSGEGWIDGWGYDESLLAEKRSPTAKPIASATAPEPRRSTKT